MKIMVDIDTTPEARQRILETIASRCEIDLVTYGGETGEGDASARGKQMLADAAHDDIVVTDDYDIASELIRLVLAVVSPEGFIFSAANMNELFYRRFRQRKEKARPLTKRAAARKERDEESAFTSLILDFIAPIMA